MTNVRALTPFRTVALASALAVAGLAGCNSNSSSTPAPVAPSPGRLPATRYISSITGANIPPSGTWSYDISAFDPATNNIYVSDRTNKGVDVFNGQTNSFLYRVTGFIGAGASNNVSGPDGIAIVGSNLYVGDGDSTVKVVSTTSRSVTATISTGGTQRADEMSYDSQDGLVMVANDAEPVPFVSLISTASNSVVGKVTFPDSTGGLDSNVYDSARHVFFQSVPTTGTNPTGEVDAIDPIGQTIVAKYPAPGCEPAGIAVGPNRTMLVGCEGVSDKAAKLNAETLIMNMDTGAIVATITQVGGSDESWYNPTDQRYYLAARDMTYDGKYTSPTTPVLGVINAVTAKFIESVPTSNNSHSVTVDSANSHVFMPMQNSGVPSGEAAGLAIFSSAP